MSESSTKAHPLLYVISALCVLNLAFTGVLYLRLNNNRNTGVAPTAGQNLPKGLQSDEERTALFENIKKVYNANDIDGILQMVDPIVRMQYTKEKTVKTIDYVRGATGNIQEGAYSYYEVVGTTQGLRTYRLYYQLKTEKGNAVMTVTVGQQGDTPYRFFGFNINMNE